MSARVAPVAGGTALLGLLGLLGLVARGWSPLARSDVAISEWARSVGLAHPDLIATMRVLTQAGATIPFLAAGLALTAGLLLVQEYRSAARVALVTALVPAVWGVLHAVLHRPRPVSGFVHIESNGFPSGHTSHATALGLLVVMLLARRLGRAGRIATVLGAVLFAVVIGVSRVALLAHWPSDVLGGWLLGIAAVGLVSWAVPAATR
jgi:undecaprenyl-diphosphatase